MARRRRGHKALDASQLRAMMRDDRVWSAIGVVRARNGDGSHWEKDEDLGDVLIDVDLSPEGTQAWVRLGGFAGTRGLFYVPQPDDEVVITLVGGDPRDMPCITSVLSSGSLPSNIDADVLLLANKKKLRIESTDDQVEIQGGDQPIARKTDPVNMGKFTHVPASGTGVTACKLLWTAPGSADPPVEITAATELDGEIKDGSSKAKCG